MSVVSAVTAAAGSFGVVYKAFALFDSDQSDENREFVRNWLLGLKVDPAKWQTFFQEIFERLFGKKHFSLKCLARSLLLSGFLITAVLGIIYFEIYLESGPYQFGPRDYGLFEVSIMSGCLADYFSLWKTRILLSKAKFVSNIAIPVGIVIADIVATTAIFVIAWVVCNGLVADYNLIYNHFFFPPLEGEAVSWRDFLSNFDQWSLLENMLGRGGMADEIPWRPLYEVALLTSAWLWVYLIVAYALRALSSMLKGSTTLSRVMDVDKHPVRTVGYFAAALSALIVGLYTL